MDITLVYILRKAERYSRYHTVTQKMYVGGIAGLMSSKKTVNSMHLSTLSSPPLNDDITAIP